LRWLLGLIPFALVAYLIVVSVRMDIESELTEKAQLALTNAGLPWARVSFEGRDAIVSGKTGRTGDRQRALQIVGGVKGVRFVRDQANLYANVSPFVWAARKTGGNENKKVLKLDGYVSSEKDRKEILGILKANFPNYEIHDRMDLASGAPEREILLSGISFGLKQLDQLDSGVVSMTNNKLSIAGTTDQLNKFNVLTTALQSDLPSGVDLDNVNIIPPPVKPYFWSASFDGSVVTLKGYFPSQAIKMNHVSLLRQQFPQVQITDVTELASGAVEDFEQAASFALAQLSRLESGSVSIRNDTLVLEGVVKSLNVVEEIKKAVNGGLPKTMRSQEKLNVSEKQTDLSVEKSSFVWVADRSYNLVTLSGFIPNQTLRGEILNITKMAVPDTRIADAMKVTASNIPDRDWMEAVRFSLWQLGKLKIGSVKLQGGSLLLSGEASDLSNYHSLKVTFSGGFPSVITLAENAVQPPRVSNYLWEADLSLDRLALTGFVPSEEDRKRVVTFARNLFSDFAVVDQMELGSGAPVDWLLAVKFGLEQLNGLESGSVELRDREILINGLTDRKDVAEQLQSGLRNKLPKGFTGRGDFQVKSSAVKKAEPTASLSHLSHAAVNAISQQNNNVAADKTVPEKDHVAPDVCQVLLDSALDNGTIRFRSASAVIETESEPLLKHLAYIARRCPSSKIEISGHTDSVGGDDLNQILSRNRAEAVVEFLVADGIARSRLKATGYGESHPLVPNSNEINKARNRRIEFRIIH